MDFGKALDRFHIIVQESSVFDSRSVYVLGASPCVDERTCLLKRFKVGKIRVKRIFSLHLFMVYNNFILKHHAIFMAKRVLQLTQQAP